MTTNETVFAAALLAPLVKWVYKRLTGRDLIPEPKPRRSARQSEPPAEGPFLLPAPPPDA